MQCVYRLILVLFIHLFCVNPTSGQVTHADTLATDSLQHKSNFFNKTYKKLLKSVSKKTPSIVGTEDAYVSGKSEVPYRVFEGKAIRHINIQRLGFEKTFTDTVNNIKTMASKAANRLHVKTRDWVIRSYLFIKEGDPLNAYELSDNERFLRTLSFVQDARIIVKPIAGNLDSVDLLVVTKDFFSITAGAEGSLSRVRANLSEGNFLGLGHKITVTGLYDKVRHPNWGYGAEYTANNIAGTFINGSVGYTLINRDNVQKEDERAYFVRLDRPLVSPNSLFAGGLVLSRNESFNLYNTPEHDFYNYKYYMYDGWFGFNIGAKNIRQHNNKDRKRLFLSARYFHFAFDKVPQQTEHVFDPFYNDRQALLGQATLFKQNFIKSRYIYGFGITEDIPVGYNIALTGGWHQQNALKRSYAGLQLERYLATGGGDFLRLYARVSGFYHNKEVQDAALLLGGTAFSRMFRAGNTGIRHYARITYTYLYKRTTTDLLRINNDFGLREFNSPHAAGTERVSIQLESAFFLKYKLLGFQLAPFPYIGATMMTPEGGTLRHSAFYTSVGGGIRARNDNLVFQTLELRFVYFPRTVEDMKTYRVILATNLRFRYNSSFVKPPDIVPLNIDY